MMLHLYFIVPSPIRNSTGPFKSPEFFANFFIIITLTPQSISPFDNMSRFFQGSDSDTDSSSSSGDEFSDQDELQQSDDEPFMSDDDEKASGDEGEKGPAARRDFFLRGHEERDESDEEEGKRVVKSAKDKRLQEIEATTKAIDNGSKINDWTVISNGI